MSYDEYRNAGKCAGTCLYQLHRIGVPLSVVSSVVFEGSSQISLHEQPFATYSWTKDAGGRIIPYFSFAEDHVAYAKLQDAWRTRYTPVHGFVIIDSSGQAVDACAQFSYKNYQISMTTIGCSHGSCPHPIAVFSDAGPVGYFETFVGEFRTVQEAIDYIDGNSYVVPIRLASPAGVTAGDAQYVVDLNKVFEQSSVMKVLKARKLKDAQNTVDFTVNSKDVTDFDNDANQND